MRASWWASPAPKSRVEDAGFSAVGGAPGHRRQRRRPWRAHWLVLPCALALFGCKKENSDERPPTAGAPRPSAALVTESLPLLDDTDDCTLGHRGITLDLGSPAAESRRGFDVQPAGDVEWVLREGSRFGRFHTRQVGYDLWIDRPLKSVALSAKVHGTGARHLSAYLDGQHLGIVRIEQGQTRVLRFPAKELELAPGRHRLALVFLGKPKRRGEGGSDPSQGEIAWVNLAESHPKTRTDHPPTRLDTLVNVVLDDQPHRSVALRSRGHFECPLWVPADARLRLSLGLWGQGKGRAEIVVSRDGEAPLSLGVYDLEGDQGWKAVDEPLGDLAGQLVRLEFIAHRASEGARIAFGEPRIERTTQARAPSELPQAKRAIVVVLSGLARKHAPPASRSHGLTSLARFAQRATYFPGYRTPSTVSSTVLASLITGRSPRLHGLEDVSQRLPDGVSTMAELLRGESGRSALFTAVPTSFADFGFDRGWERFESISPVHDRPATEPLTLARSWLEANAASSARQLVLVHLRGGHPPFDVPLDRARELPPIEYGGDLDPRRAAIQLAAVRARPRPHLRKLIDEDWTRLDALQRAALEKQDAILTRLFRWLQDQGSWDDSLVIVLGDVTAPDAPEIPFAPQGPLTEGRLHAPLLVKWPGGGMAGHEISEPVTTTDITATILGALGIEPPARLEGLDLRRLAFGSAPLRRRTLYATNGKAYATRAGEWLLRGEFGSVPTLCRLGSDPACVNDLLDRHPVVARALWQWTYRRERHERERAPKKVNLDPSPDTRAALTVWGYLQ